MADREFNDKKQAYFRKVVSLFTNYSKVIIVQADNVGSLQMQQIRIALRGKAVVLMGKNTMIKKVVRGLVAKNPKLEKIVPHIKYNIGFVFTNGDLSEIKNILLSNKKSAPARTGAVSPVDVVIPAQNTGLEPTKTSFFQALNIPTKITKGTVEIINDVHLIKKNDKVGNSEAALLQMLNIKPFFYGMSIKVVYDAGSLYDASVLDITDDILAEKFSAGVANLTALSLGLGWTTQASLPYAVSAAFKDIISLALNLENYSFAALDKVQDMLKNPGAFAAAPSAAAAAPAAAAAKKEEVKKVEEPEEEDVGGFGDLFG